MSTIITTMELNEFKQLAIKLILEETASDLTLLNEKNILTKNLSKLNVESLAFMEIVMELEERTSLTVSDEQLSGDPLLDDFLENIYKTDQ